MLGISLTKLNTSVFFRERSCYILGDLKLSFLKKTRALVSWWFHNADCAELESPLVRLDSWMRKAILILLKKAYPSHFVQCLIPHTLHSCHRPWTNISNERSKLHDLWGFMMLKTDQMSQQNMESGIKKIDCTFEAAKNVVILLIMV